MRIGRYALAWVLAASMMAGCKKSDSHDQPSPKKPPVAAPADAAPLAKNSKPAPPSPPTKEERRDFRGRLKQGRDLVKAGKYAQGMAELEAAVKLEPTNSRALSELGWAAFKANHLSRSIEASRTAVNGETDPRVAAASLYNLGRALEAKGDRAGALAAYEESLDRRPNQTVLDRFNSLEGVMVIWAKAPGCGLMPSTEAELCDCFRKQQADPDEPDRKTRCDLADPVDGFQLLAIGDIDDDRGFVDTYLAQRVGDKLQLLASVESGGIVDPNSHDNLSLQHVTPRKVAGRTVWTLSIEHEVGDEPTMTRVGNTVSHAEIYCTNQTATPSCTKPIVVDATWTMTLGAAGKTDPEEADWFRKDFGHDPPATWSYKMKTSLSDTGVLTVQSVSGIKRYRITYNLW